MEPKEAFPYKEPSEEILKKYAHIFEIEGQLPSRLSKTIFDKLFSGIILVFSIPILILVKLSYVIEGLVVKENSGPMFFYYWGVSAGKKIPKYKIRLIKEKYIDSELAKENDWLAYSAEWKPETRTYTGTFVKNFYIDELPQLFSILKGDMAFVGPRPLSVMHYERDLQQGNITRKLLKGGLLGLGHIRKGHDDFGSPIYEYEYIDNYINLPWYRLILMDLNIIFKGFILVLKGEGL